MNIDLNQLKETGLIAAIGLYIFQKAWDMIIGGAKRRLKALENNTLAITELQLHMKELRQAIQEFPKLKQDVTMAHVKIRDIEEKLDQ